MNCTPHINALQILGLPDWRLEKWLDYGSLDQLLEAFSLADKIRYFHFCLSFSRIKICLGIENFKQYDGYIANALRMLIDNVVGSIIVATCLAYALVSSCSCSFSSTELKSCEALFMRL